MFTGDCKTMEQKRGYPNLDAAKFLCALLIVVIHTSPLQNASPLVHFYVNDVITRVAVPLFFAMSGFLFFRKLDFVDGKIAGTKRNFTCIVKATRKNVLLYTPGLPESPRNRALAAQLAAAQRELKSWGVVFTDGNQKRLITAREAREMKAQGQRPAPGAVCTPLAKEILDGK